MEDENGVTGFGEVAPIPWFGTETLEIAEAFLAHGEVHVIASDTHATHGSRQPWPTGVAQRLESLVGEAAAQTLIYENPARVVGGRTPHAVEPAPKQRRRFWPFN